MLLLPLLLLLRYLLLYLLMHLLLRPAVAVAGVGAGVRSPPQVHRIGQTRPVRVVRYVIKDSVEEAVVKVQQRKQALATGALRKMTADEMRRAREHDFASLFDLVPPQ